MSKQTSSSSSSSMSSSSSPQFNSGLMQSFDGHLPDVDSGSSQPETPINLQVGGAKRWEIRYDELKFDKSLGKGAYGEVFAGMYRKNKVAIKIYDFKGDLTEKQKMGVIREANLMETLRSDYLTEFRGICLDPRYCLVMEHCEGGSLRARLDEARKEISVVEQMRWAMQISYGLYQLHGVRIVHRDLKGENILLNKYGNAKVADFGLSIIKSSSVSKQASKSAGTLPWMAPELHEDKSNSAETDVYSLGVVLWEIVSRQVPFAGLMAGAMISKTMRGQRDPLPEQCPEVFRLMITACWDLEPKKRPTAEYVGEQFDAVLKTVQNISSPVSEQSDSKTSLAIASKTISTESLSSYPSVSSTSSQSSQSSVELSTLPAVKLPKKTLAEPDPVFFGDHKDEKIEESKKELAQEQETLASLKNQLDQFNRQNTASFLSLVKRQEKEKLIQSIEDKQKHVDQLQKELEVRLKKFTEGLINRYQDPLITYCEKGDLEKVKQALLDGADPLQPNTNGKLALPAAVWGMHKDVIAYLNNRLREQAPTWEECVAHNKKHYGHTFYYPEDVKECKQRLQSLQIDKDSSSEETDRLIQRGITLEESKKEEAVGYKECQYAACSDEREYGRGIYHNNGSKADKFCCDGFEDNSVGDFGRCVFSLPPLSCCCFIFMNALYCICCECDEINIGHDLLHMTCCLFPCMVSGTKLVPSGMRHVANSEVAAQTLFGEMTAIRQMQERLMASSSEKESLRGPSNMEMN
jgi:serine/threonine protein kinase